MVLNAKQNRLSRLAAASRKLIEGDMVDKAQGRFSRTVFAWLEQRDLVHEQILMETADKQGLASVALRATGRGLRAVVAFTSASGERIVLDDCAIWLGDIGGAILVSTDPHCDFHIAVGTGGLELRPGRPVAPLGAGIGRARRRLDEIAASLRDEDVGPTLMVAA